MCSDVLGGAVDINGGGIDLAFPHHENQLAQSEAYWGTKQWVNTFLHTGHLHIEGRKMSKSLKNFITIRAALQHYSARQARLRPCLLATQQAVGSLGFRPCICGRQVRLLFLMQHWAEPMELRPLLSADGQSAGFVQFEPAVAADKTFAEFFFAVKARRCSLPWFVCMAALSQPHPTHTLPVPLQALLRSRGDGYEVSSTQVWGARERELAGALEAAKRAIHEALCDNVDTPTAVRTLLSLVRSVNGYLNALGEAPRPILVAAAARFVSRILTVFGVLDAGDCVGGDSGGGRQEVLAPVLDVVCAFRNTVRCRARRPCLSAAFSSPERPGYNLCRSIAKAKGSPGDLLKACDSLRDSALPSLGVKVDDKADGGAMWKLYGAIFLCVPLHILFHAAVGCSRRIATPPVVVTCRRGRAAG